MRAAGLLLLLVLPARGQEWITRWADDADCVVDEDSEPQRLMSKGVVMSKGARHHGGAAKARGAKKAKRGAKAADAKKPRGFG